MLRKKGKDNHSPTLYAFPFSLSSSRPSFLSSCPYRRISHTLLPTLLKMITTAASKDATGPLIPVIDFSLFTSDPEECARQVGEASRNIGFFYLKNHGVSKDLIDRMFRDSEAFFQQPLQNKTAHLIGPHNIGYSPMKSERLVIPKMLG